MNVPELKRQLEQVGIDTTSIYISERAQLPTTEQNAKSAFEYGECLQEALQQLILQGAMLGPLFKKEVTLTTAKVNAMGTKVKPTGKVQSLVDCSKPRLESEGTPGYIYRPD